jgi:hypothetical protein
MLHSRKAWRLQGEANRLLREAGIHSIAEANGNRRSMLESVHTNPPVHI